MIIKKSILKRVYKKRKNWSHKFNFGYLLIIGGSKLYSGSPGFNALAALRSGCDLVTIAAPKRAANIIASFSPDLITYPLKGDYLSKEHIKDILELSKNMDAVVIGGGLCKNKKTLSAIREYLKKIEIPAVIDADAIHAIPKNKKVIKKNSVITPHAKEFYALTGKKPSEKMGERMKLVKKCASELKTIILLKGYVDIVSDGSRVALNKTGNTAEIQIKILIQQ